MYRSRRGAMGGEACIGTEHVLRDLDRVVHRVSAPSIPPGRGRPAARSRRPPPANRRAFPAPEPGARSGSGQFPLGKSLPESHSGKYWSLYVNIEPLTEGKLSASSKRLTTAATDLRGTRDHSRF